MGEKGQILILGREKVKSFLVPCYLIKLAARYPGTEPNCECHFNWSILLFWSSSFYVDWHTKCNVIKNEITHFVIVILFSTIIFSNRSQYTKWLVACSVP